MEGEEGLVGVSRSSGRLVPLLRPPVTGPLLLLLPPLAVELRGPGMEWRWIPNGANHAHEQDE